MQDIMSQQPAVRLAFDRCKISERVVCELQHFLRIERACLGAGCDAKAHRDRDGNRIRGNGLLCDGPTNSLVQSLSAQGVRGWRHDQEFLAAITATVS